MKYPIGIQTFENIRKQGFVYVDKTQLVYKMVSEGNVYFLCRPRRFGKSLLVSTLRSYFEGRKDLFDGLSIEKLETEWAVHPVFLFDFNGNNFTEAGTLEAHLNARLGDYERIYGCDPNRKSFGDRFKFLIEAAAKQTGRNSVVLIDEYDKPILDVLDTPLEDVNRSILKGFYSTFKSADASLRFVFLTGVTKFSQVSVFSGFNQPKDISMNAAYDALCGLTSEELHTVFAERIEEFAAKMKCSVEEMKHLLRKQYDGYHFSEGMTDVYNPFSILNALDMMVLRDFWFSTGTPAYLVKLLNHTKESINDLTGKFYDASMFADYKADVERPLPMIYQSGYLTIKDYNPKTNRYKLDIPNNEVRMGFLDAVAAGYFNIHDNDTLSLCQDAFELLADGKMQSFVDLLTAFLASIPYDAHESLKDMKMTEKHFQYTFYLLARLLGVGCTTFIEKEYSQGRVDCILEMENYVYILEFKLNGSADEALKQINNKGYATPYLTDGREVVMMGLVFSSSTRTISDWKARTMSN